VNNRDITGIILSGGQSTRMGTDKAFIRLGNKTFIEHTSELIREYCCEILISTNNRNKYLLPEHRTIADEIQGLGPIGGIYTCLKHSITKENLVVAVDIPFINSGLIQYLLSYTAEAELVIPCIRGGSVEPLCAVYSKSVVKYLEAMIAEKDLKVQNLMHRCSTKVIQISEELDFYNDRLFFNVNNPDDLNVLNL